ncbi:SusC/RagA family TonB-linked outer membrane protein [Fulvivirgaceae bacterium BMA12]|uniref:SusC/RagA family TonB-linked outer membrane protein n=1 Tax=Agaribacillus aureus TaxID=3051825 RepID=A0ABT8L7E0_9BACT|nr:SusC/RagA family TonB-linked outer membrane protein [Fulvivirgaceae bacterium BMA12]
MTKILRSKTKLRFRLLACLILLQCALAANTWSIGRHVTKIDRELKDVAILENDSIPESENHGINHKIVKGRDLQDIPAADLENLLQGRLSGFFVQNWTGSPGVQSIMSVTSVNTLPLNIDNKPLILINDIPIYLDPSMASRINPLSQVSPENIESIELLNRATSLALYGARGSNGVIRITTRDGSGFDRTRISLNVSGGVNFEPQLRQTISGNQERIRLRRLYDKALVLPGDVNGITLPPALTDSLNSFYGFKSDWQEQDYEPKLTQNYNLNIGNSGVYGHYFLHLGYYNEESSRVDVGLKRYNLNLNTRYNVTNRLFLDVYLHAGLIKRGNAVSNLFSHSFFPQNDNSTLFPPTIFIDDDEVRDENTNNHIIYSTRIKYNLTDHIKLKSLVGLDYETGRRDFFLPSTINNGEIFTSSFTSRRLRIINENTINYFRNINNRPLNFTLGQSIIASDLQFTEVSATRDGEGTSNFVKTIGDNFSLQDIDAGSFLSKNNLFSFFADIDYEVINGLTLRGVVRLDGTSKLPKDERWGVYPALGMDWKFGGIDLLSGLTWLSSATLSADFGWSGTLPVEDHLWKSDIRTVGDYGGITGVTRYARRNDSFTNPKSTNANVGLNIGLLQNKVFASAEYFINDVEDYYYQALLPNTVGFSPEFKNGIGMKTTGLNFSLSSQFKIGGLLWHAQLNTSIISNEVTALPSDVSPQYGSLTVGKPINGLYAFAADGHYANDAEVPVNPKTGKKLSFSGVEFTEGMPKILDKNGDYILDQNDRFFVGSPQPDFYGGFANHFEFKGFYLDALFSFFYGGNILTESVENRLTSNMNELNRGMFQSLGVESNYYLMNTDDNHVSIQGIAKVEEATHMRLNNLTVGYRLNEATLSKLGFSQGRIYVTGQNLFVGGSSYSGLDPEENWNAINRFDLSTTGIPRYKSVSLGVSIGL